MLDRLASIDPALDAVSPDAHVSVSRGHRPARGFMRRGTLRVGAVEDELRVFIGRQRGGDVILVVAAEEMCSGNYAGSRSQAPSVRVIDINVGVRIGHQRSELVGGDDSEVVLRLFVYP